MRGRAIVMATIVGGVAVVVAAVVAGLGPEDQVVCGTGHTLNRIAQAVMQPLGAGHLDGPSATFCVVPSMAAWLMAAVALLAVIGLGALFLRERRRS